jgi:hypothetical protein
MVTKPSSVIALLQYVVGALIVIHGIIDLQASHEHQAGRV